VGGGGGGVHHCNLLHHFALPNNTLLNRTPLPIQVAGIIYNGLEAASVVGTTITPSAGAVAVLVTATGSSQWGEMSIIDSSFDMSAAVNSSLSAIVTDRSIYLNNVYVRG
jgi:hypothetical protein